MFKVPEMSAGDSVRGRVDHPVRPLYKGAPGGAGRSLNEPLLISKTSSETFLNRRIVINGEDWSEARWCNICQQLCDGIADQEQHSVQDRRTQATGTTQRSILCDSSVTATMSHPES